MLYLIFCFVFFLSAAVPTEAQFVRDRLDRYTPICETVLEGGLDKTIEERGLEVLLAASTSAAGGPLCDEVAAAINVDLVAALSSLTALKTKLLQAHVQLDVIDNSTIDIQGSLLGPLIQDFSGIGAAGAYQQVRMSRAWYIAKLFPFVLDEISAELGQDNYILSSTLIQQGLNSTDVNLLAKLATKTVTCSDLIGAGLWPLLPKAPLSVFLLGIKARALALEDCVANISKLPQQLTQSETLRATAGLTLTQVLQDMEDSGRKFFLRKAIRKLHTWKELKDIFGASDVDPPRRAIVKAIRDLWRGFLALNILDVNITIREDVGCVELNVSLDPTNIAVEKSKIAMFFHGVVHHFCHPDRITLQDQSEGFVSVLIFPVRLDARRLNPDDSIETPLNAVENLELPTSDSDFTSVLSTPPANIDATVLGALTDQVATFNTFVTKIQSDISDYDNNQTANAVDFKAILTEISNGGATFDAAAFKNRVLTFAAQVKKAHMAYIFAIRKRAADLNATLTDLRRQEAFLKQFLFNILKSSSSFDTCNTSIAVTQDQTPDQVFNLSLTCGPFAALLNRAQAIKRQLFLVIVARKACERAFADVNVMIGSLVDTYTGLANNLTEAVREISTAVKKTAAELRSKWESSDFRAAVVACIESLSEGNFTNVQLSVNFDTAMSAHKHVALADMDLTAVDVTKAAAQARLNNFLSVCVAQSTGGDVSTYISDNAQTSTPAKRSVEQATATLTSVTLSSTQTTYSSGASSSSTGGNPSTGTSGNAGTSTTGGNNPISGNSSGIVPMVVLIIASLMFLCF